MGTYKLENLPVIIPRSPTLEVQPVAHWSGLALDFATPLNARIMATPLQTTFGGQFNPEKKGRWLHGDILLHAFAKTDTAGTVPASVQEITQRVFLVYAALFSETKLQPVAALIATQNLLLPENVYVLAIATDPEHRRQGFGRKLIQYMVKTFDTCGVGEKLLADTNDRGDQVSGGWSPVPAWLSWGFIEYGRMRHYGTGDSSDGNGVFLYCNIHAVAQQILSR